MKRIQRTPRELQGKTLGWQIRHARKSKGWTQTKFANLIGVTKTYVSVLENDRQDPSLDLLRAIFRITGASFGIAIGPALDERSFRDRGD